ncbi:FtsH protease activity modulator HflK [Candidatus Poribacteria bacterium]|nr:FtsH protease activity modulator HflK [Candidatus Poribacteria bacterium]MYI93116.1 FtsH protease activity modulator HflK [Candidatus Poribacteria bacterium]
MDLTDFLRLITPKRILIIVLGIVVLISLSTSFYTVEADEIAVVLLFGKSVRKTEPGLHFKLPFGIEKAKKVQVRKVFKEEFGFRTLKAGIRTEYDPRDFSTESLLLTADLSIADVEWVVQYKIKDPEQYLFSVRNPKFALRDLSEAVMSRVIGDRTVTEVLTVGRIEIATEVEQHLQTLLDLYETGLDVATVTLQDVNPPDKVKPSYNAVNEAKQEKDRLINEAWRDYNQSIPKSKGLASQQISEAQGYALKRVNEAQGDADKFNSIRAEYQKAKEVTRQRLYLETMQEILPKIKEIYVIDSNTNTPIPILQLKE